MPHSFSLPFNVFLQKHRLEQDLEYTTFLTPSEIQKALQAAVGPEEVEKIIKGERSVITSCGSGMTAGVLWLGLQLLGAQEVGLYDEVKLNHLQAAFILNFFFDSRGLDML
jgi:thiosulfate/3-mercaptopyruvate sulfurtransferase